MKLFALEEAEVLTGGVELEAAPEVGEVADAQVEVEADAAELAQVETGIDEGVAAADQLEQVEQVVEQAAEGEGLDPIAAESIKLAFEAICARVGANPKSVYSLYATENFASASSRKANTKYALEGLTEFLKNLWEKIKAAIASLTEKIKAFWNKHVSSLGRTLKALESMKEKVSQIKGTVTYDPITAPASLRSVFPSKAATLGVDEIKAFKATIDKAVKSISDFRLLEDTSKAATLETVVNVAKTAAASGVVVEFGNEESPLPGGNYFKWEYKLEVEKDDNVGIISLNVEEDHGKLTDGRKDTQLDIANKDKLKTIISETIQSTKELIKHRDKVEARAKAVTNTFKAIDKEIQSMDDASDAKAAKSGMRMFNLLMSKGPLMETKLLLAQMAYTKGVLAYAATCLKYYKA